MIIKESNVMKDMLKNIINKTYFKVAIINLVIFGIANILFNIKYEQVDDMIIYSLYSGLDSTYNIHGIYIYPLICLVLSNLYKICSIINWHTVLLLSMQFICFTVIGTILLKNKSSKVGYILYTIFASICYTSLLLLIQYTSVSALLIATAFFIIFDMQEEKSFSKRKKVFADILFVLGIMIRLQSLMIILPFFIVYLVYIILKNKRTLKISDIKVLVKQYIILFILTILIYSSNIIFYNTNSLYSNLTYVPQETILLHSTIYNNIKIAKPDATDEEIYNAAKKAELHNFIESLEYKYDTIVGERGIKLSGGQRQRIALARIFLRDSKIVIFDEATSSLDNNTEFKIQKNINKYFDDQTIICIAHRLSTLKDMDNILVIEKGKIVDYGTPDYIIPKYDNEEFMAEESYLEI